MILGMAKSSTPKIATAIGFIAVLLWSLLALFTAASGSVPPFQLLAMTFVIASVLGLINTAYKGSWRATFRLPLKVWIAGVGGLFGYHFLYFTALDNAPPVEAGLIAYLWPLLIVVLSALLPGEKLRAHHIIGGLLGLLGAGLIVSKGGQVSFAPEYAFGYAMAFLCALTWSSYSVVARFFKHISSDAVGAFCIATLALATLCHFIFETTVIPQSGLEWGAIAALGFGPVGIAFFVWDYGMKNGDIQILGASAYAAPLLSTLVLIVAGFAQFTWVIGAACLLITFGAVLSAKDLLFKRAAK